MEQNTQEAVRTRGRSAGCVCLEPLPPVAHVSRGDGPHAVCLGPHAVCLTALRFGPLSFAVFTAAVAERTAWLNLHIWVFVLFINN